MTVICWDGKKLAADKRAVTGGGISRTVTKIIRHGDYLLGMTGDWDTAAEMRQWFIDGAKAADFPPKAREDKATLIVIDATGIRTYGCGPHPMWIEQKRCAWGSGRDFAESAMFFGHDAREGCEVACHFQTDCGNGIDVLELPREGEVRE
jgi:hypothetical protein